MRGGSDGPYDSGRLAKAVAGAAILTVVALFGGLAVGVLTAFGSTEAGEVGVVATAAGSTTATSAA